MEQADKIVDDFLNSRIDATTFSSRYISYRRQRIASRQLDQKMEPESEFHGTIFCLLDLFEPEPDRRSGEIDANQLKDAVAQLIKDPTEFYSK
jgi:Bacterial self-protective colicin-like immunity